MYYVGKHRRSCASTMINYVLSGSGRICVQASSEKYLKPDLCRLDYYGDLVFNYQVLGKHYHLIFGVGRLRLTQIIIILYLEILPNSEDVS